MFEWSKIVTLIENILIEIPYVISLLGPTYKKVLISPRAIPPLVRQELEKKENSWPNICSPSFFFFFFTGLSLLLVTPPIFFEFFGHGIYGSMTGVIFALAFLMQPWSVANFMLQQGEPSKKRFLAHISIQYYYFGVFYPLFLFFFGFFYLVLSGESRISGGSNNYLYLIPPFLLLVTIFYFVRLQTNFIRDELGCDSFWASAWYLFKAMYSAIAKWGILFIIGGLIAAKLRWLAKQVLNLSDLKS